MSSQSSPLLSDVYSPTATAAEEGGESTVNNFVLQKVQPALLGLMDGSVSTLAPLFATAQLTGKPMTAFFVGLAASSGAGISMGLAEALSDDGKVTGRGTPIGRGAITGLATALGGMLHTLPFLIPDLKVALKHVHSLAGCWHTRSPAGPKSPQPHVDAKDNGAADNHLHYRLNQRTLHETATDVCDRHQFNHHDDVGQSAYRWRTVVFAVRNSTRKAVL